MIVFLSWLTMVYIYSNEAFALSFAVIIFWIVEFVFFCTVGALRTFKEAVYEDPHMVLSNWNTLDSDPCDWNGVSCTGTRDHVIKM